jgi:uncharacterized protein YecT (DUF1311 family)
MKLLLLISLSLCSNHILAQQNNDPIQIYNSQKFSCDTGTTTLETSICLATKFEFADSLLNVTYHKIIGDLDKEISQYNSDVKILRSKKTLTNKEKDDLNQLTNDITRAQKVKQSVVKSQGEWIRLRDSNEKVTRAICEGGAGCNVEANQSLIDDTLERIKKFQQFR